MSIGVDRLDTRSLFSFLFLFFMQFFFFYLDSMVTSRWCCLVYGFFHLDQLHTY
jgi:hypothetical protein